jgi:hypothetical protein
MSCIARFLLSLYQYTKQVTGNNRSQPRIIVNRKTIEHTKFMKYDPIWGIKYRKSSGGILGIDCSCNLVEK